MARQGNRQSNPHFEDHAVGQRHRWHPFADVLVRQNILLMNKALLALAVMISLSVLGCTNDSAPSKLPTITMKIGSKTFTLKVANDEESRRVGLMNRDSMPADH